jgi:phage pi2 protein 07
VETKELIIQLIETDKQKLLLEKQAEIAELKEQLEYGSIGNMRWFCERVDMSQVNAKERILYPFRKELEGKAIKYPETQGQKWQFNKAVVNKWIVENFERW